MSGKVSQLRDLVAPVVESLGYELWGLEYSAQGKHALVRIYIDAEQGIDVDDCARVSRQVSSVFDVEDPIACEYNLEVSSPGMDRPLYTLEQFGRYIGEQVKLRLRVPFEGRRNFSGVLVAIEDEEIVMAVDEHEYLLPFELIDRANIIPRF